MNEYNEMKENEYWTNHNNQSEAETMKAIAMAMSMGPLFYVEEDDESRPD